MRVETGSKYSCAKTSRIVIMKVCPISMANASGEKECIGEKCLLYMSHPIEAYPITHQIEGKCRLLTYLQSH